MTDTMKIEMEVSEKDLRELFRSFGYEVIRASDFVKIQKRLKEVKMAYSMLLGKNAVLEQRLRDVKADEKVCKINEQALVSAENALIEKDEVIDDLSDEIRSLKEENDFLKRKLLRRGNYKRVVKI